MKRYWWACSFCGSKNVNCSGTLHWDFDKQDWTFEGTPLDDDFCEDCEQEVRLEQVFEE